MSLHPLTDSPCQQVAVFTGDADDAGFDGTVYVSMTGSEGTTSETKLDASSLVPGSATDYKPFGKSSADVFTANLADVGQISYANVRIEATGSMTSW